MFEIKNVMKRGIRKILTFVKIAAKIFRRIILKPLSFRKDSSCTGMIDFFSVT